MVLIRPSDKRRMIFVHGSSGVNKKQIGEEILRVTEILSNIDRGVINRVIESGEGLCIANIKSCEYYQDGAPEMQSEACVPLIVAGRTIGALNAESSIRGHFTSQDGLLLQCVANQLALVIEHSGVLRRFDGPNIARNCAQQRATSA